MSQRCGHCEKGIGGQMNLLTEEEAQHIREDICRQFAIPKKMLTGEGPQSALAALSEEERRTLRESLYSLLPNRPDLWSHNKTGNVYEVLPTDSRFKTTDGWTDGIAYRRFPLQDNTLFFREMRDFLEKFSRLSHDELHTS